MKKTLENRQSFTRGLMQLLVLMAMLLAPKGAWAAKYTTSGAPESVTGQDWKFTWTVSGDFGSFKIYASTNDAGSVTERSDSLIVNSSGCEIRIGGPYSISDYFIKIFKVKISGKDIDNSKISVKVEKSGGNVTFIPSTTTPGEFYLLQPESWDSYGDIDLSIVVNGACAISSIDIYSTQIHSSVSYSWANKPTYNGNAIENAMKDDTLNINKALYPNYKYPILKDGAIIEGAKYSSSITSVASFANANDSTVTLGNLGSAVIFATVPFVDEKVNDSITFGYNLKVINEAVSYGLTVAGTPVTSDNFEEITGANISGNVSFVQQNDVNMLILEDATIDMSDTEGAAIEYTGTERFVIRLIGTNSIITSSGSEPILYAGDVTGDNLPELSFEDGSLNCSLALTTAEGTSVIKGFKIVSGVNGIGDSNACWMMLSGGQTALYSSGNGLYTLDEQVVVPVYSTTITSGYGIMVADNLVHSLNASNVLNDNETLHKVIWENNNKTLTLNNVTLNDANGINDIRVSDYAGDITIEINGKDSIAGYITGDNHKLTVKKVNGAAKGTSLTITDDENPVNGFSDIVLGEGLNVHAYSYNEDNGQYASLSCVYYSDAQYQNPVGIIPNRITFSEEPVTSTASIWIGGKEVKSDGTFEGINNVSFDSETNTLTLTNAEIGDPELGTTDIISSLNDSLVINLVYTNAELGQMSLAGRIVSLNPDAEIRFKGKGDFFINTPTPISGFSNADNPTCKDNLVYIPGDGYAYVMELGAPWMAVEDGDAKILYIQSSLCEDFFIGNTLSYSINYVGQETPVTGTITPEEEEEGIVLAGACTVTAINTFKGKSVSSTGKYYEYDNNQLTLLLGQKVKIPTLSPTCTTDTILVSDDAATAIVANDTIKANGVGNTTIRCYGPEDNQSTEDIFLGCENLEVSVLPNSLDAYDAIDTIEDSVYTGSIIVPTFTLRYDEDHIVNPDNYDVVYKLVREEREDSVVTAVKDAGKYKVYAVAKEGSPYIDEKLVYEEFVVEKASIKGLAISDTVLTYNGQPQNLLKVTGTASVPSEATLKFYCTPITQAQFDDTSYETMCEPGDESFTTTLPTGTNVGYFALLYKVDGGANYNDIHASKLLKSAIDSADIANATIAAIADTAFTGKAIEPELTVTFGQTPMILEVDEDYTVAYTNNINVGTATATITGKGNFKGTKSKDFNIVNKTLNITFAENQTWASFYNTTEDFNLPNNMMAYIVTEIGQNSVTVAPINYVPKNVAVLLKNNTTTTGVTNTSATGNLLQGAGANGFAVTDNATVYALYNNKMMRVASGTTIPAGKCYLVVGVVNAGAPQLNIVFENEGNTTGINASLVNSEEVKGDLYDLQGRKVVYPKKKGLYIQKGRKVVVNNK